MNAKHILLALCAIVPACVSGAELSPEARLLVAERRAEGIAAAAGRRLVLSGTIERDDLDILGTVVGTVANATEPLAVAGGLFTPYLESAGFTESEVALLFGELETALYYKGYLDPVDGRVIVSEYARTVLAAVARGIESALVAADEVIAQGEADLQEARAAE